jgi:hypothetical protein
VSSPSCSIRRSKVTPAFPAPIWRGQAALDLGIALRVAGRDRTREGRWSTRYKQVAAELEISPATVKRHLEEPFRRAAFPVARV